MASVITIAGEKLFAAKAQANEQLDIDTFIFANVPAQDPAAPINRDELLPADHVVHQQIVQQVGRINENVVVYSTVLDSVTGPFEFNWVGLYSSVNQTLVAINHIPTTAKTITEPGAAGNTLNRNFGIEYSGIADLTGIDVAPETWQLDFTARLQGMDELTRQLAKDINGSESSFIDDGFKVVPRSTVNTFSVLPGVGYVNGLRVELLEEHILITDSYPKNVYLDAYFEGEASSVWKPKSIISTTNDELSDYIDESGKQHYLIKIANITAAEQVDDLRVSFTEKQDSYVRNFKTVSDAKKAKFLAKGQEVSIEERGNARFFVDEYGASQANEFDEIDHNFGKFKFKLSENDAKNLASYGATPAAFDAARENTKNHGTIFLPAVTHFGPYTSQFEELKGEGSATVIKASDRKPAITIKRKTGVPDWDFFKISDMTIDGTNADAAAEFDKDDPFAGRAIFDNVSFFNGDSGVSKKKGHIGDGYYICNFQGQDFGWNANSSESPIMHTGATVFQQTNWDVIEKACIKSIDNVDGPGAISARDSLMQGCNGFGVFMQQNNFVPAVPHTFDNLWMELIAKSPKTEIDGVIYDTREMYFEGTVYAVVKGTYVKSMQLKESVVHLQDCRMDDASGAKPNYLLDNKSIMIVDDVFGNGEIGGVPYVRSIANQRNTAATKNCSVRGPLKKNRIKLSAMSNATNICSNSYSDVGPWVFTGSSSASAIQVDDGILSDTCAELVVPNGATLLSAEKGTPTEGKWVVWGIHAKKISGGNLDLATIGFNWTAGEVYLRNSQWVCSYGIKKAEQVDICRLRFVNNSGSDVTLRLADFFCVEFDTFEEAIEFVNSGQSLG